MINLAVHSAIIMRKESCKRWAANTALKFIEMFHIHLHVILQSHISLHCWSKVFAHFNVCLAVGFPITRLSVYKFMSIIGKCVMQNRRLSGSPHFAVFGKKNPALVVIWQYMSPKVVDILLILHNYTILHISWMFPFLLFFWFLKYSEHFLFSFWKTSFLGWFQYLTA